MPLRSFINGKIMSKAQFFVILALSFSVTSSLLVGAWHGLRLPSETMERAGKRRRRKNKPEKSTPRCLWCVDVHQASNQSSSAIFTYRHFHVACIPAHTHVRCIWKSYTLNSVKHLFRVYQRDEYGKFFMLCWRRKYMFSVVLLSIFFLRSVNFSFVHTIVGFAQLMPYRHKDRTPFFIHCCIYLISQIQIKYFHSHNTSILSLHIIIIMYIIMYSVMPQYKHSKAT